MFYIVHHVQVKKRYMKYNMSQNVDAHNKPSQGRGRRCL